MTDVLSREARSRCMSRIRPRDTLPEIRARSVLHRAGFRYVLHDKRLPGRPDIVFPRYRTALFVHGCFWHRHHGCRFTTYPATRRDFWAAKFEANVARDREVRRLLEQQGWAVAVVWECETRDTSTLLAALRRELPFLACDSFGASA